MHSCCELAKNITFATKSKPVLRTQSTYETPHYCASWTPPVNEAGLVEREQNLNAWGNLRNPYSSWHGTIAKQPMFSRAGGYFWDGVCNGLICAGLNHALHLAGDGGDGTTHRLKDYNNKWKHVLQRENTAKIKDDGFSICTFVKHSNKIPR